MTYPRFTAVLFCLAACSSSHPASSTDAPGSGGDVDAPLTAATACSDAATARCTKLMACSAADLARRWGDLTECETRETLACTAGLAAPATAATPSTVAACGDAIAAESCADFFTKTPPAACTTQHGAAAAGAACAFSAQCASGFCAVADGALCGQCAPQPAVGDSCATTGCGQDLVCAGTTTKTCQVPVGDGGACSRDLPCADGWTCVGANAQTATQGVCTADITTTTDPCDARHKTAADCSADAGLTCDTTTNTCVQQPLANAGETCGTTNGITTRCTGGATCVLAPGAQTGTCTAPAADGAACDDTAGPTCLAPARCVANTCQLPGSMTCS